MLDLKNPTALDALKRLAATADVFIQNFRPGVAERIGVGEDAIRAVRRNRLCLDQRLRRKAGPTRSKPVYDPLIQAMSGLATVQAGSDEERPRMVRTILPDKLTAITASQAITAALLARERTGEGQHVRLSMLEAVMAFLWGSDMGSQTFVTDQSRPGSGEHHRPGLRDRDGYITAAVQTDKQWEGSDPRPRPARMARRPALQDAGAARREYQGAAALTQAVLIDAPRPNGWTADRGRRALRPGADPHEVIRHPHVQAMASCRGIRAPDGRPAAPEPRRRPLLRHPDRDPPRRPGARRALRRRCLANWAIRRHRSPKFATDGAARQAAE